MKHKRFIAMILASSMLLMGVPVNAETSEMVPVEDVDLIPDEANLITPNYVCTWSNQDWTAMSRCMDSMQ